MSYTKITIHPVLVFSDLQIGTSTLTQLSVGRHDCYKLAKYLSMRPHDGSQQLPRPPTTIHAHHAQYLEEAQAAQGGSGEHLAAASET